MTHLFSSHVDKSPLHIYTCRFNYALVRAGAANLFCSKENKYSILTLRLRVETWAQRQFSYRIYSMQQDRGIFYIHTDYTRASDTHFEGNGTISNGAYVHYATTQARRSSARTTGPHRRRGTGQTSWTHPPAEFHHKMIDEKPWEPKLERTESMWARSPTFSPQLGQ